MSKPKDSNILIPALWVAFFTFLSGLIISLGLESIISAVRDLFISFVLLGLVILSGIVSDAIGTAAAAADIVPFNAMAAKKIPGASQAVRLVQNADLVANLTADVIGDIAGTLSGAIGASIVYTFNTRFAMYSFVDTVFLGAAMTSLIAALTVGGKTVGKSIAINNANTIIFKVAGILRWFENITGFEVFPGRR
ncbi:MAG: hypothetical protein GXY92_07855 [Syntrophomonadaceae bacterium]|nr:hypothetical protein [Syntrophomonadaceae bacterium]